MTLSTASATTIQMPENEKPREKIRFLWLELTRKCNLECVHCYENSSPRLPLLGSLSTQDWIQVLEQASNLGIEMVQFIGGEPTLFRDLDQLIEKATQLQINVEVYTNGTTIDDRLWQVFVANNVSLAFSYYSNDPELHDQVTTKNGSHVKTRTAILRATELGLSIRVGVIQMPEANEESVRSTIAELNSLGVKNVGSDRTRGIGRGVVKLSSKRNPFGELCGHCGNGKMAIDNNGNVFPCVFSKFTTLGHVSAGLENIANGLKMELFKEKLDFRDPKQSETWPCHPKTCRPYENCSPSVCIPVNGCSP